MRASQKAGSYSADLHYLHYLSWDLTTHIACRWCFLRSQIRKKPIVANNPSAKPLLHIISHSSYTLILIQPVIDIDAGIFPFEPVKERAEWHRLPRLILMSETFQLPTEYSHRLHRHDVESDILLTRHVHIPGFMSCFTSWFTITVCGVVANHA